LTGKGRMQETEDILNQIIDYFTKDKPLKGKTVLITAGPTYEKLDPVRFIGNFSSGKMGFALAEKAAELGAKVILISGPVNVMEKHSNINRINVVSADDMFYAVQEHFPQSNIFISAAAVADYKPENQANDKIKKSDDRLTLTLTKNKDILKHFGNNKSPNQVVVGFALETSNEQENALKKLLSKNADMIVLNSLNDKGAGFQSDTNKISILFKDGKTKQFPLKTKIEVANDILNEIITLIQK